MHMTKRLASILANKYYKDPKLFTKTIYRKDGSLRTDMDTIRIMEKQFFKEFVSAQEKEQLLLKLKEING